MPEIGSQRPGHRRVEHDSFAVPQPTLLSSEDVFLGGLLQELREDGRRRGAILSHLRRTTTREFRTAATRFRSDPHARRILGSSPGGRISRNGPNAILTYAVEAPLASTTAPSVWTATGRRLSHAPGSTRRGQEWTEPSPRSRRHLVSCGSGRAQHPPRETRTERCDTTSTQHNADRPGQRATSSIWGVRLEREDLPAGSDAAGPADRKSAHVVVRIRTSKCSLVQFRFRSFTGGGHLGSCQSGRASDHVRSPSERRDLLVRNQQPREGRDVSGAGRWRAHPRHVVRLCKRTAELLGR